MFKAYKLLAVLGMLLTSSCYVKNKTSTINSSFSALDSLLSDTAFKHGHIGVVLVEQETGNVVQSHNADKYFVPASNTKLFTTYASLKFLKDSLTGFYIRETVDTLYIKPNGDPTFLHRNFSSQKMFNKLRTSNKVLVIEKAKDDGLGIYGNGWSWANLNLAGYAERTVMPLYENLVRFHSNASGKVTVSPSYFQDSLKVEGDLSNKRFVVTKSLNTNYFVAKPASINNTVKAFTTRANTDLPYRLLQDTLKSLNKKLIIIDQQNRDNNFWKPFYTQKTLDVVRPMMYDSDNFLAEQLLIMVGTAINTFPNDQLAIINLKRNHLNNMSSQFLWADGSGLSRSNQVTPRGVTDLLAQMKKEFGWQKITEVLPSANVGPFKGYYVGYEKKMYGKGGRLGEFSLTLSGYLITKKGNEYLYSLLTNNHAVKPELIRRAYEKYLINIIEKL